MNNLKSIPFSEKISRLRYLLSESVRLLGRDKDIIKPVVRSAIFAAIEAMVLLWAMYLLLAGVFARDGGSVGLGIVLLLIGACLFVYKYFYFNYQEVRQSYLVYQTLKGEDHSYAQAAEYSRGMRGNIRKLAGLDMLMAWLRHLARQQEGGGAKLLRLIVAGLNEVWDLVNHYLIPAMVIDRVGVKDGVESMRRLRDEVPASLVGVFGIDLFGHLLGRIVAPVYALLIAAGLAVGILLPGLPGHISFGINGDWPQWLLNEQGRFALSLLPLFAAISIGKLGSVVLARAVTGMKVLYFTVFYVQITHPDRVSADLAPELVGYLRMDGQPDDTPPPAPGEGSLSEPTA